MSSYSEGERVLGPPQGSYDADWVASAARQKDPGLPEQTALLLARRAWEALRADGALPAPELSRWLMAQDPAAGATAANVVAIAALEFCASYAVELPGR